MPFNIETVLESSGLAERARREVPRALNRLLGQTFVHQDVEADKEDYYFVQRNRPVIETLLAVVGFKLLHDEYHHIFQAVSEFGYCRARYRLDETLMIVVLRKLYEERAEHLNLAADPVVTVGELRDEYRTITGKERDLGIMQYEAILRHLRALGLIDTVEGRAIDVRDSEARLRLRGSVRMILPVQNVDEMDIWLRKYRVSAQEAGEEEAAS